ncbi:hypothetical protein ACNKHT_14530 [Shigella flexneri]
MQLAGPERALAGGVKMAIVRIPTAWAWYSRLAGRPGARRNATTGILAACRQLCRAGDVRYCIGRWCWRGPRR